MFVRLFHRQNHRLSFSGTNLQIVLNTQKIPTQIKPPKFSYQKNTGIENFKTQNPFIIPIT